MEPIDGPTLLLDTFVSLSLNAVGDAKLSKVPPNMVNCKTRHLGQIQSWTVK